MTDTVKSVPKLRISQFLLEKASFEHRSDYLGLPRTTPVNLEKVGMEIEVRTKLSEKKAIVRLRVFTDPANKDSVYQIDVTMVGLLVLDGVPSGDLSKAVGGAAGSYLFPFVREAVANLTARGRFGPAWIQPTNVRAELERASVEIPTAPSRPALGKASAKAKGIARKKAT